MTDVYADPRVTSIDDTARYQDDFSDDGGRTWQRVDLGPVCGGHVQIDTARAIRDGRQVTVDGPVRTIAMPGGTLVRWTPTH